jgi:hypothetical protein
MQQWAAHATEPIPLVPSATSGMPSFFQPYLHSDACSFYLQPSHHIHMCQVAMDYVLTGHVKVVEDKIHLPNRQVVPNDGTRQGIKASIDLWLTLQTPPASAQIHIVYMPSPLLPLEQYAAPPTQIKEVAKANILQITKVMQVQPQVQEQCENEDLNIFQVFAAKKKKCDNRVAKIPKLTNPPQEDKSPTATPYAKLALQYQYHSNTEDQQLVSKLHS